MTHDIIRKICPLKGTRYKILYGRNPATEEESCDQCYKVQEYDPSKMTLKFDEWFKPREVSLKEENKIIERLPNKAKK